MFVETVEELLKIMGEVHEVGSTVLQGEGPNGNARFTNWTRFTGIDSLQPSSESHYGQRCPLGWKMNRGWDAKRSELTPLNPDM